MADGNEVASGGQPATGGEVLTAGAGSIAPPSASAQTPTAAVAVRLMEYAEGCRTHLYLASSERRADEIGRALQGLAADLEVLVLPPWDCLPYDRASPSRDIMGRRLRVQQRLGTAATGPRVLVTSPEALMQKLAPPRALADAFLDLACGQTLDRVALADFAARTGYVVDDRIDEPGEIALLGEVIDVFPADAPRPVRIVLGEGDQIKEIRVYDPISQRSEGELATVSLPPASELIFSARRRRRDQTTAPAHSAGAEHRLSDHYGALTTLFDLLPADSRLSQDPKTADRLAQVETQIWEAFEAQGTLRLASDPIPAAPRRLYLLGKPLAAGLAGLQPVHLAADAVRSMSVLAGDRNPGRAFCDLVARCRSEGHRVVLTGLSNELRPLAKALGRGLELAPSAAADWTSALAQPAGVVSTLIADFEAGFVDGERALTVIAASDVLGGRLAGRRTGGVTALISDPDLRIGDVVLHEDHGIGVLRDLVRVEVDGALRDALALEYKGGASLLAPIDDIGKIWRYGAEADAVSLDRLGGAGWAKRRAEVSRQVDEAAQDLVALARARDSARCPPISAPKAAYARFAARFSYPETPDQAAAIAAVADDLASGRPMDRLICGDVGFGKTEVALRAAAIVALAGRQVAIAAPTTVLARQHFDTFSRRFAGTGVKVGQLSRLASAAEVKAVLAGLADGGIGVVVGTHALAGKGVRFADLGLMIIDEEQKFGATLKADLRSLSADGHRLALTATPIPRTMQAAMVGVQDVSVIISPPARRRPIRTFLAPFDPATLRTALLREKRRGGQSFFVTPRIEDIGPLAAQLAALVPELEIKIAHGELPPQAADEVMVGFAAGEGDVLLATNIIESGLDVPRANTMVVWRPDRFGLAQLHQLRGRVGRGRVQGVAYLLADPVEDLSPATRARLSTLEAFDRLGSGLAISARDLDLRGGGDLVGEEQAGHVKMIGAALYQRLLARAMRLAAGEAAADEALPTLKLGAAGGIPEAYVPDAVTRINLYARLARLERLSDIDAFEVELDDRFGPPPADVVALLGLARLQRLAIGAGVRQVAAGPKGVALSLTPDGARSARKRLGRIKGAELADDRLVLAAATLDGDERIQTVEQLLTALSEPA